MTKVWESISALVTLALVLSLAVMALPVATPVLASPGTHYYVNATTGDDSRDATQAQNPATPWKTISHAVATVPAGASPGDPNFIQVMAGTYATSTNGEAFPISFANANVCLVGGPSGSRTIDGGGTTTILDIGVEIITIIGFTINNATNGIRADVGGFNILDNIFSNVGYGVYFYINETELTADYIVYPATIVENEFNISTTGVCTNITLDYNAAETGKSVTIGDIDIMDNTFNMTTTTGIYIDIRVSDLTGGSVSMGDIDISDGNEFYGGIYGIDFEGYFNNLTDTTVTVGDVIITGNTFQDQTSCAMEIDYYEAEHWHGTTTGTYGDLVINDNNITSTTTDAIYISTLGEFKHFYNSSALTVGDLYIEGNQIDVSGCGIYLEYYCLGYEMYDSSQVTTGEVHIGGTGVNQANTIDAGSNAIYINYEHVAYTVGTDIGPCDATLNMGDISICDNTIAGDSDGIYMGYYRYGVGYNMYDDASARLPDYVITGNTFNVTGDGIELDIFGNPFGIYDNSTFDFGGFFIDDNTFNDEDVGMDYGICLDYGLVCYSSEDDTTTIIGNITITNNWFYDLDSDAIYVYYDSIGFDLGDNALLQVGDLAIADNVIDAATNGIWVDYYYIYSYDNSTLTMGNLDITGNDLSNITTDGICVYYDLNSYDNSTQTIGRALIQDNILDPIGAADGIYVYMFNISEGGTSVINLGEPIIDRNLIEYWTNGIYLRDVDGATISNNLIWHNDDGIYLDGSDNIDITNNDILTNPGPASGVHLDSECGPDTVINYNNIVANSSGDWGIYNASTNVIDAENNWWGDPSGPDDDAMVINGTGDKISNYVDADPWLTQQSHLTIYEQTTTATATGTATVQTDGGAVTDLEAVDESTLPTAGKPDLTFPHGFFSFNIIGLTPGQTVVVTLTLPDNVPVGTEYWKYHASEGGWIEIPMGSDNGDNIITITLVDGGLGDDDLTADGVITDQGAPGFVPHPVGGVGGEAYPVNKLAILAPWLGLAMLLIGGITWFTLKRRKAYR